MGIAKIMILISESRLNTRFFMIQNEIQTVQAKLILFKRKTIVLIYQIIFI